MNVDDGGGVLLTGSEGGGGGALPVVAGGGGGGDFAVVAGVVGVVAGVVGWLFGVGTTTVGRVVVGGGAPASQITVRHATPSIQPCCCDPS